MTKIENLLVVTAEECAEIQQAISKAMRFGMDNYHPRELLQKLGLDSKAVNECMEGM